MTCQCDHTNTNTGAFSAVAKTVRVPAGSTLTVDGSQRFRRTATVTNRSTGRIVVSFGADAPVDGSGPGVRLDPGDTAQVATTAAVVVLNPTGTDAEVAYLSELDS